MRELTGQLRSGVRAALDDLRALARGIYPPVLADQGLRAALQAQASLTTVTLNQVAGRLEFSVADDGTGFTLRLPRAAPACRAWPTGCRPRAASWG